MKPGTIFAPASAVGRAGIAVIRVSGEQAAFVFDDLCAKPDAPRRASRVSLYHPASGEVLDDSLVLWFPAPNSFTGEDVVEFHVHGGRSVIAGVLEALGMLEGFRLAEPGEFTRRAFENDKMDLTAAEGLADLIDAETAAQRRQALRQMGGALGDLYEGWRARLIESLAYLEATIDFSEEDIPDGLIEQVQTESLKLMNEIEAHLADGRKGERLREGVHIAILGAPNAGKSSLLNALAQRDAAIVSETAGTTRDIIEVQLDLGGYPVVLADTAGIRESQDDVEQEGVRRALTRGLDADLKIVLLDGSALGDQPGDVMSLVDDATLPVINKIDLHRPAGPLVIEGKVAIGLSVKTGEGVDPFLEMLGREVKDRFSVSESALLTRARHREALGECIDALRRALSEDIGGRESELVAEDLRLAARGLGRITGRVDVEDLLDKIFGDFCIGK